jgi:hypothetical protein
MLVRSFAAAADAVADKFVSLDKAAEVGSGSVVFSTIAAKVWYGQTGVNRLSERLWTARYWGYPELREILVTPVRARQASVGCGERLLGYSEHGSTNA